MRSDYHYVGITEHMYDYVTLDLRSKTSHTFVALILSMGC